MKDAALGGEPFPEDVEHIVTRIAVMDDHREIQLVGQFQLCYEQLDLGFAVPEFPEIVQTDLTDRDHTGQLRSLLYGLDPVFARILDF